MNILGIDMGWSKSVCCLLESNSGEVSYQTVITGKESFSKQIPQSGCDVVVIEAGPMAGWVKDLCDQLEMKLVVVNTNDEPWQWRKVKKKTDRKDALKLCRMMLMDQVTTVHVPQRQIRQWRQLIFYRDTMMCEMTAIKNRLRAILLQEDIRLPAGAKAFNGPEYQKLLEMGKQFNECRGDELWRGMMKLELARLEQLMQQVDQIEAKLEAIAKADERIKRLKAVPGVGPRTAELVVAMIDDPHRFGRAREVGSYAGFVPKKFSSGKTDRDGRISRCGNALLRKYLVQAAWAGKGSDPTMNRIYQQVRRNTPKRSKQAIVAVARHLLVWLWAMLRDKSQWRQPRAGERAAQLAVMN